MSDTHFGFETVSEQEKAERVKDVFDTVTPGYDIMNDVMSLGMHRLWKRHAITWARIQPHHHVLDVASGTADLGLLLAERLGPQGSLVLTDINEHMLHAGRDKMINSGHVQAHYVLANAEQLPFPDHTFDRLTIAFGLRNVTRPQVALTDMLRVLKPGGLLLILELSHPKHPLLASLHRQYTLNILPHVGQCLVGAGHPYRYLGESIQKHPNQEALQKLMGEVGYTHVEHLNLSGGVVALHRGFKHT